MEALIKELIGNGPVALVVAGFLLGWFAPKWVLDELRRQITAKDKIIERQALVIEKLASRRANDRRATDGSDA